LDTFTVLIQRGLDLFEMCLAHASNFHSWYVIT